jgi:hypothetical protein
MMPALLISTCSGSLQFEGRDRTLVGEVEARDLDCSVARSGPDICGDPVARLRVAHGERDRGAVTRERPRGLDPYTGRASGHYRALAAQVDPLRHLRPAGRPFGRGPAPVGSGL